MEFITLTAPEYWACYLINGDASGLSDEEKSHADYWLEQNGVICVVDCQGEGRFTWHYDIYDTLSEYKGGSVLDYTCDVRGLNQ